MTNTIANTILNQLGGGRFAAMTGAKNLLDLGNGVQFRVGRNAKRVTHVRITLDPSDTYSVQFHNVRGHNVKLLGQFSDIYADMLVELFETETGLYTSL